MTASMPSSSTLSVTVLVTELHHSMGHYSYSPQLTASMNQIAAAVSANLPPTDRELEAVQRVMASVASQLPPPESFQEMMKAASAIQSNSEVLKLMSAWATQGKESSR